MAISEDSVKMRVKFVMRIFETQKRFNFYIPSLTTDDGFLKDVKVNMDRVFKLLSHF